MTMPASVASPTAAPSLFRGRWLWATLAVVVGCMLFFRLGIWQLQRLQQRRENNAELVARLNQPVITITGAPVQPAVLDLRRAVVRGTYDFSREILLRNQELGGVPGVHLLTPLHIEGSSEAVLVDRGWIPITRSDPAARAEFSRPAGTVEVHGVARQTQTRTGVLSPDDPSPTGPGDRADAWFRVNIERIQPQVPYPLLPIFVQEGEPSDASAVLSGGRLPVPYFEIDLSEGPHLAYALQWFSFALILAGGYFLFYRRRISAPVEPESWPADAEQDIP